MMFIGFIICEDIIFQNKLFRCCPKTSANYQKNIAGNTFQDHNFGRKGFHARSFLGCFPKSLYRVLATD